MTWRRLLSTIVLITMTFSLLGACTWEADHGTDAGVTEDTSFSEKKCWIADDRDTDAGACFKVQCPGETTEEHCIEDGEQGPRGPAGEDGEDGERGPSGKDGISCSVDKSGDCATLSCGDGTSAEVCGGESCTVKKANDGCARLVCPDGSIEKVCDGQDGERGPRGPAGESCSVEDMADGALVVCEDGTKALVRDGEDGKSCTVKRVHSCAFIFCEGGNSARVCDGEDGADGQDGNDAVSGTSCSIEEAQSGSIIVCGDGSTVFVAQDNSGGQTGDAGMADTGMDSGTDTSTDTGTADTGQTDTGTADTGTTDTGQTDTGTDTSMDTGTGLNVRFSGSDNSVVEVDPSGLVLNDGTPLDQVANPVVVHWAPGEGFNASENSISDVDGDGWIEIPLPQISQGDQPYSISCSADSNIPYRFQLARVNPSSVGDWLDLSGKTSVFGDFFWKGVDDSCVCTFSLSVSWNGSSYYTTSNSNFSCTP